MKRLFFLSFATLVCMNAGARESPPPHYTIVSSEPQAGLGSERALFELQFNGFPPDSSQFEIRCNDVVAIFDAGLAPAKEVYVSPGTYVFRIATTTGLFIVTDSISILPGYKTVVSFMPPVVPLMRVVLCKPVIYCYPEKEMAVDVKVTPKGDLTFTYPDYEKGWRGTAHPDGSITIEGKTYPYLFWEAEQDNVEALRDLSAGFVVKQEEVVSFLEEKLTEMGFNDTEKTDFITYWAPRMVQSEQGYAQFLFNTEYDALATLSVSPDPNEVFRVYLLWTPLENGIFLQPKARELPKMSRKGFHVLEWGGTVLPALQVLSYKQ